MARGTWLILSALLLAGCASKQAAPPVTTAPSRQSAQGVFHEKLKATCFAPAGWVEQPIQISSECTQQIWISPSGRTSYGIIHFGLPFPVAHEILLFFFLAEMRKTEGEANLVSKQFDDALPGLRYVARGGRYTVHSNLLVSGFDGWVVYAGTLTNDPVEPDEFILAERAREQTKTGDGSK
jgi:hypothetical protein